jgi:type I site-specific restriction endonuclease
LTVGAFLRQNIDHVAVAKLRMNRQLTVSDLKELERLLGASGAGSPELARLYESPFTDLAPHGPDGVFKSSETDELLRVLEAVRENAVAA